MFFNLLVWLNPLAVCFFFFFFFFFYCGFSYFLGFSPQGAKAQAPSVGADPARRPFYVVSSSLLTKTTAASHLSVL